VWYMAGQSSWMAVIMSMFGLGNGMTHVIPEGQFEIARFLRDIERFRVTVASLFPTMMQRAIREVRNGHYDLASLRVMTYGSAPAAPRLLREAHDFFGCGFLQAYGLTESGGWVTHLSPADHREGFAGRPELLASAGRPGLLYDVAVCDDEGRPLPAGSVGEVWVRGPSMMKGYVNLPEQTAQVLKGGWLRTQDIGRLDAEGYLYLVDRRNFMIISGAVNVYPAGVEAVLLQHPDIEEAAVLGAPHPEWGEAVVAIVRAREGRRPGERELASFCHARLSGPESPKHVVFVDELPRNSTGKVDKAYLRNWLREHAALLPWSAQAAEESLERSGT
jgi:acyl-CoA synthetase (AMP-forming)/AMP-acid ligase II